MVRVLSCGQTISVKAGPGVNVKAVLTSLNTAFLLIYLYIITHIILDGTAGSRRVCHY